MLLAARIGQTLAHIVLPPTDAATALRFSLFVVQVVCMVAMGAVIATALSP